MPAHTVQIAFPEDVAQLEQYDAIVISDIGSNTFLLQNDTFYQLRIKPNALELIKEYVNNGGGLLMIGGGNDSNLLIMFYVQIMPDDFVMQLHRF